MEFTQFILLNYAVVEGADREAKLRKDTRRALEKVFTGLTEEEKDQVKVLRSRQNGYFKIFILFPCEDTTRVSQALGEVWDPDLVQAKELHVLLKEMPICELAD